MVPNKESPSFENFWFKQVTFSFHKDIKKKT